MSKLTRRSLLALTAAAPIAGQLMAVTSRPGPREAEDSARRRLQERNFPNVLLTTHLGEKVRFYDDLIKGKIVTLNFMFTQCSELCPLTTNNLVKVQKLLGDRVGRDIFMYSFTLDPEHDTPEVLKNYAEMHHVGPGWTFLTGSYADLELLRKKLGFVDPNPAVDKDRTNHIGTLEYGNEPLMLWAGCPSLAHPDWVVKEISWVIRPKEQGARL